MNYLKYIDKVIGALEERDYKNELHYNIDYHLDAIKSLSKSEFERPEYSLLTLIYLHSNLIEAILKENLYKEMYGTEYDLELISLIEEYYSNDDNLKYLANKLKKSGNIKGIRNIEDLEEILELMKETCYVVILNIYRKLESSQL